MIRSPTIKPLEVSWLFLVLLQEIRGLIQNVAILWDEEVSISLVNLELLPITDEEECVRLTWVAILRKVSI